jgi:hypothetical protein
VLADLAFDLPTTCFAHPNYLKINGRPVILVYVTRAPSARGTLSSSMSSMRNAASSAGYDLYVVGDQAFGKAPKTAADISLLDAVTNYDVYGSTKAHGYAGQAGVDAYYAKMAAWRSPRDSVNVSFVPACAPGFNDKWFNPERGRRGAYQRKSAHTSDLRHATAAASPDGEKSHHVENLQKTCSGRFTKACVSCLCEDGSCCYGSGGWGFEFSRARH